MRITKLEVSRGVHWVEIPEAGLRVLCGCPADAIKHLIKRGLVLPQEVKGVACETGPNAILLSDVALQNGEFANLAEFPVLQMLYKQGLIIPNHPNNTGRKPMLIGAAEQVGSQVRYIYRGNYGLVSQEEIVQAGVDEKQAHEIMRLKLKFAFGRIRPTQDFIDARILADNALEIAEGVTLRREQANVFEFAYKGETITVDLNLKPGEHYECPYPLGYRRFESEYFSVIHSGEGDGWDANRPCMASILTFQGRLYLIDAGPQIAHTLAALGIAIDQVDGIFHTHAHDDHFAGIATLLKAGRRIRYFATPLVRASVTKKLCSLLGMEERHFADFFDIRDLVFDTWNDVDGLEVMPVLSPHPVETNILIFRTLSGDAYRTYAHYADIVSLDVLKKMVTDQHDAPGLDNQAFEAVRAAYLVPADLKKIDVGGGMIHGEARDFRTDRSNRILLAHRAGDLTPAEKEIGSSAAFGTIDVLAPRLSDVQQGNAGVYLRAHFPGVPLHYLQMLLNNPVREINPGALILKEGETPSEVLLLISGIVDRICTRDDLFGSLRVGSLIGDGMVLNKRPSPITYRASSFVRVLQLPAVLYTEVIQRNGLQERVQRAASLSAFLETTKLFAEGLPVEVFGHIVDRSSERAYQRGEVIPDKDLQVLNIIRSGRVERMAGGTVIEVLEEHDFFGEEGAILKAPSLFGLRATLETSVLQIPGELLKEVPSLFWKLLDSHHQRTVGSVYGGEQSGGFVWRDAILLNVAQMDRQHMRLIEIGNAIIEHLDTDDVDRVALVNVLKTLGEYMRYHFAAEEELMTLYRYPGTDTHCSKHKDLVGQVTEYEARVSIGEVPEKAVFMNFFETWFAQHTADEDRKYGEFLNSKGVY